MKNPGKPARKRGRPTKAEAFAHALTEIGVDPDVLDPRRILAGIAADETAPASARVNAARALMAGNRKPSDDETASRASDLDRRMTEILNRRAH